MSEMDPKHDAALGGMDDHPSYRPKLSPEEEEGWFYSMRNSVLDLPDHRIVQLMSELAIEMQRRGIIGREAAE